MQPRMQPGGRIHCLAGNEVEKLAARLLQVFGRMCDVHPQPAHDFQPRNGTMVKGTPVETVWMGREGSTSFSAKPAASTTALRSCSGPNSGSTWVISPNTGCPGPSSKRTGTLPTLRSSTISLAPLEPRNANAVPSVG